VASYAGNGYFVESPSGTGRAVFDMANELLDREDVDLCHPELVRQVNRRAAFAQQWHLGPARSLARQSMNTRT
jgi:hypothetical protein